VADAVERSIESILNWVQFPYVKFDSAIEILGHRYYYDQAVYSMMSWPVFIAVAMLYSTIWRRTWIEALLNAISAVGWCFVFQCGLLLTCIRFSVEANSWSMWWLAGLWAAYACGLFVSTERGLRILLQPISESSLDSRLVNPFVLAWNWCFATRSLRASGQRLGERWFSRSTSWVLVGGMVLTLVLQLVQAPRALAALSIGSRLLIDAHELQEFVFQKGEEYEYRHTYHSPPLVIDREVDIWTVYAPLSTTEHIICIQPRPVFDLETLIESQGGQMEPIEYVPAKLPNGQHLTYGSIALNRGRQPAHVYYAWLDAKGVPLEPTQNTGSGYLLMSQAEFVKIYSATAKRILVAEFSRFVVGIQNQLVESPTAP